MYKVVDFISEKKSFCMLKNCLKVFQSLASQEGYVSNEIFMVTDCINTEDEYKYAVVLNWHSKEAWLSAQQKVKETPSLINALAYLKGKFFGFSGSDFVTGPLGRTTCNYSNPVVLFDIVKVTQDRSCSYVNMWQVASKYMSEKKGYLSSELISIDNNDTSFINIARWGSKELFLSSFEDNHFKKIICDFENSCQLYLTR